jgi:hypothetical protein
VGEVAVVQPPAFFLSYRGQLQLPATTSQEQPYLAAALASLTQGTALNFLRTPLRPVNERGKRRDGALNRLYFDFCYTAINYVGTSPDAQATGST